jgi:Flp pilus assembly protein TadB
VSHFTHHHQQQSSFKNIKLCEHNSTDQQAAQPTAQQHQWCSNTSISIGVSTTSSQSPSLQPQQTALRLLLLLLLLLVAVLIGCCCYAAVAGYGLLLRLLCLFFGQVRRCLRCK